MKRCRSIPALTDGSFTDSFDPFAVNIYEITPGSVGIGDAGRNAPNKPAPAAPRNRTVTRKLDGSAGPHRGVRLLRTRIGNKVTYRKVVEPMAPD